MAHHTRAGRWFRPIMWLGTAANLALAPLAMAVRPARVQVHARPAGTAAR